MLFVHTILQYDTKEYSFWMVVDVLSLGNEKYMCKEFGSCWKDGSRSSVSHRLSCHIIGFLSPSRVELIELQCGIVAASFTLKSNSM